MSLALAGANGRTDVRLTQARIPSELSSYLPQIQAGWVAILDAVGASLALAR